MSWVLWRPRMRQLHPTKHGDDGVDVAAHLDPALAQGGGTVETTLGQGQCVRVAKSYRGVGVRIVARAQRGSRLVHRESQGVCQRGGCVEKLQHDAIETRPVGEWDWSGRA